jgi:hypothetical protein
MPHQQTNTVVVKNQHISSILTSWSTSGEYLMEEVENYDKYLLALDIPERVVRNLFSFRLRNF